MIYIGIGKIKADMEDLTFYVEEFSIKNKELAEYNNSIHYSGSTRNEFLKSDKLKEIFKTSEYIKIEDYIEELREIKLYIPTFHNKKCLWEWFMVYV